MKQSVSGTRVSYIRKLADRVSDIFRFPEDWEWNYDKYYFNRRELVSFGAVSLLIVWAVVFCFYHSIIACVVLSPLALLLLDNRRGECRDKRLGTLSAQFKDGICFVSGAINAGYSLENAFKEAGKELVDLYGETADITREFTQIVRKIDMNIPVQDLVMEFGERTGIDDIKTFGENLVVAKKTGGNLPDIIGTTSKTIAEKQQILRDIETMVAAKKMEQNIMTAVPLCIIAFVNISSPGFLGVLYHNPFGVIVMSICLAGYYLAFRLSKRILRIVV